MPIFNHLFVFSIVLAQPCWGEERSAKGRAPSTKSEAEGLEQRCFKDDAQACYRYGIFAWKVENQLYIYRMALRRACRLKHIEACEQLDRDDREGEEIKRQCELGKAEACAHYAAGRIYMYSDIFGALDYFNKACRLGHKESCEQVRAAQAKFMVR